MNNSEIRLDGLEKVTGRAVYANDIRREGMLYLREIHCPHPHARIDCIDLTTARAMPGIVDILTGDILPDNPRPLEKPLLAKGEVICAGEAVALIAAESEAQAAAAANAVLVRYTPLPAVTNITEALAEDAPKVHPKGNIACECILEKGASRCYDDCAVTVEADYTTQRIHHGAIEPDCVVAEPDGDGITILCGSKGPFNIRKEVAQTLMIPEETLRVKHTAIGGGFGGKMVDSVILAARAVIMAQRTGRPCKLAWSREETMIEGSKRHPFQLHVKLGADKSGRILSGEMTGYADAGAYLTHTKGVIFRAMAESLGPYAIQNAYVNLKGVYTHTVYSDAVRGFGTPQVAFAMESTMDMLADKLGLSPFEFRRRNLLHDGDTHISGQIAQRTGIEACARELANVFPVEGPRSWIDGTKIIGRGLAYCIRGESHGALSRGNDICGADVDVMSDGRLRLSISISDLGQGAYTAEAMALAELLGVPITKIYVRGADTAVTPPCTTTSGSRGTISGVNAVWLAYLDMTDKLSACAAARFGTEARFVRYRNGKFYTDSGRESLDLDTVIALYRKDGHSPHFEGRWVGPYTGWDWEAHTGTAYYSYSYGVCGAEVEVDTVTGQIKLRDLVMINDLGKIINYEEAKAQIAGGLMMSVGFALTEDCPDQKGILTSRNFDHYIMQMARDLQNIRPMPVALVPAPNPMGVHGVGEMSASVAAPAIANAAAAALGVRFHDLPLSLERVRAAIDSKKEHIE